MENYHISDAVSYTGEHLDIYITHGKITKAALPGVDYKAIDGHGKTAFPSFIDLHTHLDKAHIAPLVPASRNLIDAIRNTDRYMKSAPLDDFLVRGRKMIDNAILQGTGTIRTHITLTHELGIKTWTAAKLLSEEYRDLINLQLVLFPMEILTATKEDKNYALLSEAAATGAGILGGIPSLVKNPESYTDILFRTASELNMDLDFHVDEKDDADASVLEYITEKTLEYAMQGRVTAGHCTSLNAIKPEEAQRIIDKVVNAGINIVTLPSCNLYLMGRNDKVAQRRGTTRIVEFLKSGCNISLSSDNIRDPFRPFGNGDLMEEALLTAQILQDGSPEGLQNVIRMITTNPAKAARLNNYGLENGSDANLLLIEGNTAEEVILNQGMKSHIFLKGNLVASRDCRLNLSEAISRRN